MKLYEIQTEYLLLLDDCDPETGELLPGIEDKLNSLEHDMMVKADNIGRFIQQMQAESESYSAEAERLNILAKQSKNKAERLRSYLLGSLQHMGITKLDTERFKFSVCKNSQPTTVLAEGAAIPQQYERIKVELDSRKVVQDWKDGATLPPGITVMQGFHLRLR